MIRVKAAGFPQFLAAHAVLRAAGVAVVASGGNEMRVPDDTDVAVLRAVAATGAVVHADLSEPAPPDNPDRTPPEGEIAAATQPADDTAKPAPRKPRKTTRRTTRE